MAPGSSLLPVSGAEGPARFVDLTVVGGGRFLVLADDEGSLTCINRKSSAILWRRRLHAVGVSAVDTVSDGVEEQVLSIDRLGDCLLTDPLDGRTIGAWQLPGCKPGMPHRHLLERSADREHVVASCLEPVPPSVVGMADAAAAWGFAVNVHDNGGHVVLLDRRGVEISRTETVKRPLAAGASTRVTYLRAPGHWVGVRDLRTGTEITACPHCYERGGYAVAISPDERWVAWSGYEKYIARSEVREFVRLVDLEQPDSYGWNVLRGDREFTELRFSPDGALLAVGDAEGAVTLVRIDRQDSDARILGAVAGGVTTLAFADAETVVALGAEGEVRDWTVKHEEPR